MSVKASLRRSLSRLKPIVCAAIVGACSAPATPSPSASPRATEPSSAPTTDPSPTSPGLQRYLEDSTEVSFAASDGIRLSGRIYGHGPIMVVLAHMGNSGDSQLDWYPLVLRFPRDRYSVLTFDRRGVCPGDVAGCSRGQDSYGDSWKDVVGAVRFARRRGAETVIAGGASIGAMASLYAIEQGLEHLGGFIWIAGLLDASGYRFTRASVRSVHVPTLIISARSDPYLAEDSARQLLRWMPPPKHLAIVPSDLHGTDMLGEDASVGVRRRLVTIITGFVEAQT